MPGIVAKRSSCGEAEDAASSEEERAELHADFLEQAEVEQPLEKCVEYIRDNPDEFLDEGILGR